MMLSDHARQRLQDVPLLPELRQALEQMVVADDDRMARECQWGAVIPTVQSILGGPSDATGPFLTAWCLMYAAVVRLDHLQDGDPVADPLPTVDRLNAQYNLVFSYYVLAAGVLDLLSPERIPLHRIMRLRRLWTDMLLRMASGQQRDLARSGDGEGASALDDYQQLAQAKTGATFALAFGGTATLLTDDTEVIAAFTSIGEIYGTLLQYSDDLLDAARQPNATLTLPKALEMVRPIHATEAAGYTRDAFGAYIYHIYREQVVQLLANMPTSVQHGILDLFARTFEPDQAGTGDAA